MQRLTHSATVVLLLCVLLAVGVSGAVASQPEDPPSSQGPDQSIASEQESAAIPPTPGVFYKMYLGSDFIPRESTTAFGYTSGGGLFANNPGGDFVVHLDLPQGVRLTEVVFFVRDTSGTYDIQTWLVRYDPSVQAYFDVFARGTAGSNPNVQNLVATGNPLLTVNNATYAYQLQVRLTGAAGSTNQVVGARVGYTAAAYAPAVMR